MVQKLPMGRSMIGTLNFSFNPETTGMSKMVPNVEYMHLLQPLM